jgi:hypothetical protein
MSIKSLYPDIRPSLNLDFANSKALDGRITFTRNSTATYVGANGLIQTAQRNAPRFDHDPITGESLGLLIEEQRTNYVSYSENFNTWWITGAIGSVTANSTTSPDGNNNGTLLVNTNPSPITVNGQTTYYGGQIYRSSFTGPDTGSHTWSLFAKAKECEIIAPIANTTGGAKQAFFDLSNGTIFFAPSDTTCVIEPYPNGWYKCSITYDQGSSVSYTYNIQIFSKTEITGSDGMYIWGAQLEKGSFPTSYIPTSASYVTRAADDASMTGTNFSSWYNPDEVSVIGEFSSAQYQGNLSPASYPSPFAIDNSGSTRLVMLYLRYNNHVNAFVRSSAGDTVPDLNIYSPSTSLDYSNIKFGVATSNSGLSGIVNDGSIVTDSSVNMPPDVNRVVIGGGYGGNTFSICGSIKYLRFYSKKLSDTQLQTLTQ